MWRGRRVSFDLPPVTATVLILFVWLSSPLLLASLLCAAILHELGHLTVLRLFGGRVSHLSISPFGAKLTVANGQCLSYGAEILSTLAGPAVNLAFALILSLLGARWDEAYVFAGAQLVLGLFNLIPARPLDGGRILWLVIAWITEPFTADRVVFFTSVLFAAALLILGAAVLIRTGKSPFLLLAAFGVLAAVLREKGLVKRPPAR